jgi:hypothetical protein
MHTRLEPKLISVLRKGYSLADFSSDLIAGIIVGVHAQPLFTMQKSKFIDTIGEQNLFGSLDDALAYSAKIIQTKKPLTETVQ